MSCYLLWPPLIFNYEIMQPGMRLLAPSALSLTEHHFSLIFWRGVGFRINMQTALLSDSWSPLLLGVVTGFWGYKRVPSLLWLAASVFAFHGLLGRFSGTGWIWAVSGFCSALLGMCILQAKSNYKWALTLLRRCASLYESNEKAKVKKEKKRKVMVLVPHNILIFLFRRKLF